MLPTIENCLAVYNRATPESIHAGMHWYDYARNTAIELDNRFHRSAGVIAALSPRSPWNNNKNKAFQLYRQNGDGTGIGMEVNKAKAIRIYHGEDALDVLNGPKERTFFLNIVDPSGDHNPVIDRHAFDIAVGMRTNDSARAILSKKGIYDSFVHVYRESARVVNVSPNQFQAITWCQWRKDIGLGEWAG